MKSFIQTTSQRTHLLTKKLPKAELNIAAAYKENKWGEKNSLKVNRKTKSKDYHSPIPCYLKP